VSEATVTAETETLQPGIYSGQGDVPPDFFALLLLRLTDDGDMSQLVDLLRTLWATYSKLGKGLVDDIGEPDERSGRLDTLLTLAPAAFHAAGSTPPPLLEEATFAPRRPGRPIVDNKVGMSAIKYGDDVSGSAPPDVAVAFQFTGATLLVVERAVVETWKVLHDRRQGGERVPLEIAAVYTGSKRPDNRSWIDFHDGISNLSQAERQLVVPIPAGEPGAGGTYMAFMRLRIEIAVWRNLGSTPTSRRQAQEKLVGRDKVTGCPILAFDGRPLGEGCPREPGMPLDVTAANSHVQRANHHLSKAAEVGSFRLYRQGYPFFEPTSAAPGFRVGLNFVSFQNTPWRLITLLAAENWLGDVNFGGDTRSMNGDALITAETAGVFFAPPVRRGEDFPGAHALGAIA